MSTQSSDALRSDLAHLYRRAGFGATAAELDAAVGAGYAATVAALVVPASDADQGAGATPAPQLSVLASPGKTASAAARQQYAAQLRSESAELALWWIDRMVAGNQSVSREVDVLLARALRDRDPEGAKRGPDVAAKRAVQVAGARALRRA